MKRYALLTLTALVSLLFTSLNAIDNPHYWRATNFLPQFYEPRLAKSWMNSFDIYGGYGTTEHSRNSLGNTVPLLNLYGPEAISALAFGLPDLNFTNPVDITLQNLALLDCPCPFGQLTYNGTFKLAELNFCFSQNLTCGFFVSVHVPYRNIQIQNICPVPAEPTSTCQSNANEANVFWQTFLNLYPQFLTRFGFEPLGCNGGTQTIGVGDTSVLLGWTYNYEETDTLDYVDFTLRIGALIPTGQTANPNVLFSIPNGYDGHIAVPGSMDFAMGYYEWLTLGAHIGGMVFVGRNACVRVHTDPSQNGFLKLFSVEASVHEGTIWELGGYLKADHCIGGLSFLAGYNFAVQYRTTLKPCSKTFVTTQLVNSDATLAGWKMHTVNLYAEYDFTCEDRSFGPRIGFFYNIQVAGFRIFKTNMVGGFFGFDFAYNF